MFLRIDRIPQNIILCTDILLHPYCHWASCKHPGKITCDNLTVSSDGKHRCLKQDVRSAKPPAQAAKADRQKDSQRQTSFDLTKKTQIPFILSTCACIPSLSYLHGSLVAEYCGCTDGVSKGTANVDQTPNVSCCDPFLCNLAGLTEVHLYLDLRKTSNCLSSHWHNTANVLTTGNH